MQLKEGEILGHECMGIVESVGSKVTKVKVGDRVVAAFNIACGKCQYCQKKQYTACECTNNSSVMQKLYGDRIAGVMGYSHVSLSYRLTLTYIQVIVFNNIISFLVASQAFRLSMPEFCLAILIWSKFPTLFQTKRRYTFLISSLLLTMLYGRPMLRKETLLAFGV